MEIGGVAEHERHAGQCAAADAAVAHRHVHAEGDCGDQRHAEPGRAAAREGDPAVGRARRDEGRDENRDLARFVAQETTGES